MRAPEIGYPARVVYQVSRVPSKTLNDWDRSGLLRPSVRPARGHGNVRLYSFADLVAISAIDRLRKAGVNVAVLKGLAQHLQSCRTWTPGRYVAVEGDHIFELAGNTEVETEFWRPERAAFLIVPLDPILRDVMEVTRGVEPARAA